MPWRGEILRLGQRGDGDAAGLAGQRQARHVDRLRGLHVRPQRHARARRDRRHARRDFAAAIGRSSTRHGVGRSSSVMAVHAVSAIERQHRARQMLPGEARQHRAGQAGGIDLDDPRVVEELVEAAAEMAARFHHDDSARRRCRCRAPPGTPDRRTARAGARDRDGDAAEVERCRAAEVDACCRRRCRAGRSSGPS